MSECGAGFFGVEARDELRERIWHLALVVYAIVALSAATDICGFLRFAPTLGLPAWAGLVCVLPIKLIEWQFLTFAMRLWDAGPLGKLTSPIPVAAWCLAVCLSALAAHSTIYNALASADRAQAKKVETRANLAAAFEGVKAQLGSLPKSLPRPVKIVEQALAWHPLLADPVRRATRDCTRFPSASLHEACKEIIELRKELAVATEYEHLSNRSEELRIQLAGLDIEAARDAMPRSFDMSIGRWVSVNGKDGIALIGMLLLTMVSAFGPFGLDILGRRSKRRPSSAQAASLQSETPAEPNASVLAPAKPAAGAQPASGPTRSSPEGQSGQPDKSAQQLGAQSALGTAQASAQGPSGQHAQEPSPQPAPELGAQPTPGPAQSSAQGQTEQPAQPALGPGQVSAHGQSGPPAQDHPKTVPPSSWAGDPGQSHPRSRGPSGRAVRSARPPARKSAGAGADAVRMASVHVPGWSQPEALSAIRAFVAMLERGPQARASGSALALAFGSVRHEHGWPDLAPNTFGKLLKTAVQEVGGRKLKSNLQIYEGVRVPAAWDMQIAA